MPSIPDSLAEFLEGGRSLIVGTRDSALVPHACRAVGLVISEDRRRFTVYLPETAARTSLANLEVAPLLAVSCSEPATHRTVQLKGRVLASRPAVDADRPVLDAYREAFTSELLRIGMSPSLSRRLANWPSRAIEVAIDAVFEQTPGPGAGLPWDGTGAR